MSPPAVVTPASRIVRSSTSVTFTLPDASVVRAVKPATVVPMSTEFCAETVRLLPLTSGSAMRPVPAVRNTSPAAASMVPGPVRLPPVTLIAMLSPSVATINDPIPRSPVCETLRPRPPFPDMFAVKLDAANLQDECMDPNEFRNER